MQNLARNLFPIYYKLYLGEQEIIDEWGNRTGSFSPSYGDLQLAYLSVSPSRNDASLEPFGTLTDYDRTMTTSDVSCPINENSILWLDGADTSKPYNYYVKKRAPWKNSIAFAIKEVEPSEAVTTMEIIQNEENNSVT